MTPQVLQTTSSGAFSAFSASSWNGRYILADDPVLAYKKMGVVRAAASQLVQTLLQELGGAELCIADFVNEFKVSHFVGGSLRGAELREESPVYI